MFQSQFKVRFLFAQDLTFLSVWTDRSIPARPDAPFCQDSGPQRWANTRVRGLQTFPNSCPCLRPLIRPSPIWCHQSGGTYDWGYLGSTKTFFEDNLQMIWRRSYAIEFYVRQALYKITDSKDF